MAPPHEDSLKVAFGSSALEFYGEIKRRKYTLVM